MRRINLQHGHKSGDEVLAQVASRVRSTVRGNDSMGRPGNDELAVLLVGANDDQAVLVARKILHRVQSEPVKVDDTTSLNVHELKAKLIGAFDTDDGQRLQIAVESFGFKHGMPIDADIVMDVRFLPNPHWEDDLRPLTGHDQKVRDYVLETAAGSGFVERFDDLLASLLPQYEAEGRSYLTVAIGCTGGRHRSVAVAEELAERLRGRGIAVRTSHRDVAR